MENIQRIEVGNNRYLDVDEAPPIIINNITADNIIITADNVVVTADN